MCTKAASFHNGLRFLHIGHRPHFFTMQKFIQAVENKLCWLKMLCTTIIFFSFSGVLSNCSICWGTRRKHTGIVSSALFLSHQRHQKTFILILQAVNACCINKYDLNEWRQKKCTRNISFLNPKSVVGWVQKIVYVRVYMQTFEKLNVCVEGKKCT